MATLNAAVQAVLWVTLLRRGIWMTFPWFTVAVYVCFYESAMYDALTNWIALEAISAPLRVMACAEAVFLTQPREHRWLVSGIGASFSGMWLSLAGWRQLQSNLWHPKIMQVRAHVWACCALFLASTLWYGWRWPESGVQLAVVRHAWIMCLYFAEHAVVAFTPVTGIRWYRALHVHEVIMTTIWTAWACWAMTAGKTSNLKQSNKDNRNQKGVIDDINHS